MKYKIDVLGYESIISKEDGHPPSSDTELILKYKDGFELEVLDNGKIKTDAVLLRTLLCAFFGSYRGYPDCTLDFFVDGSGKSVDIISRGADRVVLKLPKCKVLCTNIHTFSDLAELEVTTVVSNIAKIRAVFAENSRNFSLDRLSLLRAVTELPLTDAAFALSSFDSALEVQASDGVTLAAYLTLSSYAALLGNNRIVTPRGEILIREDCLYLPVSVACLS